MAKKYIFFIAIILLLLAGCTQGNQAKNSAPPAVEQAVTQAFQQQAEENKNEEIVFLLYETQIDYIEFNEDDSQALVWFALIDEESGDVIGTEPGLALAVLTNQDPEDLASWQLTFQHQTEWADAIWQTAPALLSTTEKQTFSAKAQASSHATGQIYTGYKLPWPQGMQTKLSGSIAHVFIYKTCPDTCLYAFDFWNGEMFPVSAARGGVVKAAVWEYPNGTTEGTNYLLVEDTTTTPTTYAIYYHLAYDSIPEDLRTPGAAVYQGQFIGNADDTGASTNHHLHFMVHTNPYSYWGTSVDIVFDEVNINGGRPRTCNEADLYPEYGSECITGDWFLSDNADTRPPSAWIEYPANNTTITERTFTVAAYAEDELGISTMSLFLRQGTAGWQEVAEVQNQSALYTELDMCDLGLADGDFILAVEVVNSSGKLIHTYDTPTNLTKDFDCQAPPPACQPEAMQIALYTEPNYTGSCALVDIGDYYGMVYIDGIENDQVSSVLLGNYIYTVLYADNNLKGTYELIKTSEPDLSDNTIGSNTVSSLRVFLPPSIVHEPTISSAFSVVEGQLAEFSWSGDADEYYIELRQDGQTLLIQDWSPQTTFTMGYLSAGSYTLLLKSRNLSGELENTFDFTVTRPAAQMPATKLLPLPSITGSTILQLEWEVTAGKTNIDSFQLQFRMDDGAWQTLSTSIPADQRTFTTVLEPNHIYGFRLRAVAIEGISEAYPASAETKTEILVDCLPDAYENDDTAANASLLTVEEPQEHTFCPGNDEDWVQVEVEAGKSLQIEINQLQNNLPITVEQYSSTGQRINTHTIDADSQQLTLNIPGIWNLRILPYDPIVQGDSTAYQIQVVEAKQSLLMLFIGVAAAFVIALMGLGVTLLRKK